MLKIYKVQKQNIFSFLTLLPFSQPPKPNSSSLSLFLSLQANKMSAFILLCQSVGYMSAGPSKAQPLQAEGL